MKRLIFIIVIFFSLFSLLHAQYEGGNGDGASSYWQTNIKLDGLFLTVVYNGGNGDGTDKDNHNSNLNPTLNLSNLYRGGIGDGHHQSHFQGFLQQNTNLIVFNGGDGDGHSFSNKSLAIDSDTESFLYAGGNGDGFDMSDYNGYIDEQVNDIYIGGIGDGHTYSAHQTSLDINANLLYVGGVGDGADHHFQMAKFPLCNCSPSEKVFVNIDNPGLNNGSSWEHAFESLPNAFEHATICSVDSIWVSKGVYLPIQNNDRSISFIPPIGVSVFGGFLGNENHLNQRNFELNESILSGNIGDQNDQLDNSYHVLNYSILGGYSLIDGFYIEDGHANVSQSNSNIGAGVYNTASSSGQNIFISNTSIRNCFSALSGSGIYQKNSASMITLSDVKLISNVDPLESQIFIKKDAKLTLIGEVTIIK